MAKFQLVTTLLWLFLVLRFLLPLSLSPGITAVLGLVLLVASHQHILIRRFRGSAFSPELPRPLGMLANALLCTLLLLTVFQIALELTSVVGYLFKGSYPVPPLGLRYLIGLAAVSLSVLGVVQAVRVPPVKEVEVRLANLPPEFDGYRIIQLTDLHLSRLFPQRWSEQVVAKANAQKADLIVITGSFYLAGEAKKYFLNKSKSTRRKHN